MTRAPSHSFCWAFCLSFACLLSWFVPVEALFAAPAPLPADDGVPSFAAQQDQEVVPKQIRRDYRMVFGESVEDGPWAKQSAVEWNGLDSHMFVTLEGPCIYTPVTEIDITQDVLASAPRKGTTRFISTTGWLTGPQGTFPTRFAVCSDRGMSLFFFTGIAPEQLLIDSFADGDAEFDGPAELVRCEVGVAELAACDEQLADMLSAEGAPASDSLRTALAKDQDAVRDCWEVYAQAVQLATSTRALAIQSAAESRDAALAVAEASALLCYAAAEAALLICMASAMGWSFFGLALVTVAAAVECGVIAAAAAAACALALSLATAAIKGGYDSAVNDANAAYELAMNAAQAALEHCLEVAKRTSSKTACALIPDLSPNALAALEDHRDCYRATNSEHFDCLSAGGALDEADHGFHDALEHCGSDH